MAIFSLFVSFDVSCASKQSGPLIESELNSLELQEMLWLADERGDTKEAEKLQLVMTDALTSTNCLYDNRKINGSSDKKLLKCDHGVGGILKIKPISFPIEEPVAQLEDAGRQNLVQVSLTDANAELAAFALDQLLHLNVVPLTVKRIIPGEGMGSAQYFVKNAREFPEGMPEDVSIEGYRRMRILHFIENNIDGHRQNILLLSHSNRIVAIDNAMSFRDEARPPIPPPSLAKVISYLHEEPELLAKILELNDSDFYRVLSPYLTRQLIHQVLNRVHLIQKLI